MASGCSKNQRRDRGPPFLDDVVFLSVDVQSSDTIRVWGKSLSGDRRARGRKSKSAEAIVASVDMVEGKLLSNIVCTMF